MLSGQFFRTFRATGLRPAHASANYPLLSQLLFVADGRSAHPTAPRQFPASMKLASFCLGAVLLP